MAAIGTVYQKLHTKPFVLVVDSNGQFCVILVKTGKSVQKRTYSAIDKLFRHSRRDLDCVTPDTKIFKD